MYLRSLELIGFKSFAVRTILDFHRGVTAVVGPNGCGKSNVLDAIKWVLGEQSAKALRGGEMADVIFSGTDSRQAMGMAEVSMTFADCEKDLGVEWNEVRITRRVFRDGKGEYLINKTPCRLRDIHELFMDTGIGRSAYSIMEQGKIDQILSSKPDDRRAIFEEAAGITKYKAQKKEALRKLEHTEANLVRVADIIREVKRQIGSLQRQAGKARRYQNLSETLRIFDTHLTHRNYALLAEELSGIQRELQQIEETRNLHEEEINTQEGELLSYRAQLGTLDEQIGAVRDECQNLQNRIYSAENRIESHGHRITEFESLIDRNESDIAAARAKMEEQQTRILETDNLIEEMLSTLRANEESLRSRGASVAALRNQRTVAERSVTDLTAEIARLESHIAHLRGEKSSHLGRREAAEARLSALHAETAQSKEILNQYEMRQAGLNTRIASLERALQEAEDSIRAHEEERTVLKTEQAAALAEHRRLERVLAEIASKLDVLEALEASGEGLGEGTQAVLRGLDNPDFFTPALAGPVAGEIDIDPQFIPALDAILGTDLQAVLFKDTGILEAAAGTLAHGDYGRAQLLSRPAIQDSPAGEPSSWAGPLPEGGLAWAKDCIRGNPELLAYLAPKLAGVVIVSDLSAAFRLHQQLPQFSFVTLNGEKISADGMVSAGKLGAGTGAAILRKREISDLVTERSQAEDALRRFDEQTAALDSRVSELEAALSEALQTRQNFQVELSTARNERDLLERQCGESQQRHDSLERELAALQTSLADSDSRIGNLEAQVQEALQSQEARQSQRAEAEAALASLREKETSEADLLNELRVRVATERGQRESLERQREPMAARLQELEELMRQRADDIESYRGRIAGLETERSELSATITRGREELSEREMQGASLLAQRCELVESIEALETTLRVARKTLTDISEKRGRLEVKTTQIDLRQQSLREHIHRRYQLEIENFEPDLYALHKALKENKLGSANENSADSSDQENASPPHLAEVLSVEEPTPLLDSHTDGIPWEQVKTIVDEFTERLDAMGPVNLDAIQEFEELEQRYQFLEQQNTDLTNSKNELMEVIARINKTTRELFAETFEKVRHNFQEMFTELFGGGKANLLLVDESDPLESGIEIIAKPPGKQLQSVSLLSGGERTMTAVSLLFAIYMVKPSPFCVLDEMDAPLDESNISRFIKILDRFVGQSQFVVITHNKRTISRADMLYGVTMEEHGVSKLVGVKFHTRDEAKPGAVIPSVAESFGKTDRLHSETSATDPSAIV